jgi:hypothetical protein
MSYLWLALGIALLGGLACAGEAGGQRASVWVASPWEHVLKTARPGPAHSIRLSAARNEYEPARVVIASGGTPLRDVNATACPLAGPGGRRIAASNIRFYREHYINIDKPSSRSTATPGWYPDPLIPFSDPVTGRPITHAQYRGAPFDVEAGYSQGIWIDLYVPRSTPAGEYKGAITVTCSGKALARVPLSLTVFDFTLPETFAMRSNFGSLENALADRLGMDQASQEFAHVEDLYIDTLLAHRCMPSTLGRIWPDWSPEKGIDDSGSVRRLRKMVRKRHINSLMVPFRYWDEPDKCRAYLRAMEGYLRREGFLDLSYIYMLDEPNTAEQYETVRQQGKLIHDVAPGIKRLCTEQTITQDPSFGDLYGAVDIWCPLWGLYDEKTARERQALGEEIWSYTALCQVDEKNPFWEIDFPPIVYRSPLWVSWHYNLKGLLYWSSIYWKDAATAWERPLYGDDEEKCWGEGMLVYPGKPAGIAGPAPSIRLKLIREAMEDYQYMALAEKAAGKEKVDRVVSLLARSFTDWDRNPDAYMGARTKLANLIQRKG